MTVDKNKTLKTLKGKNKISRVLKPHGTAVWLLNNYPDLTLEQVADFCEMEPLKVLFLKNELDGGKIYVSHNPLAMGYVAEEDLKICSENPKKRLTFLGSNTLALLQKRTKRSYVSILQKKNRLSGALWLMNFYKNINITPEDIRQLSGASLINIEKLSTNRKYSLGITPVDPVNLNLCSRDDMEEVIAKYSKKHN